MNIRPASLRALFPFLEWRDQVNRASLRADVSAGLTGALVVLPQGVAFAAIAGMPPQYGLYAAMVPTVVAALFGSSHHLVSGPTTAASVVLFASLSALAEPGSVDYIRLALTLTLMVGVFELALGLARLGFLVNFISDSVIVGFTAGAAIHIAAGQLDDFLGLQIPRGLHVHEVLFAVLLQLERANVFVVVVGIATVVAGIGARRHLPRVPHLIAAMIAGSLAALGLNALLGEDVTGITMVGAIPSTLPPISTPDVSLVTIKELAPTALAVTLFALTEAVSISRSLAALSGQLVSGNREFIGQGLSNIVGSFCSSYVATGSFNRSAVNYHSGAVTPLAAVTAGLALMVVVVLAGALTAWLPHAATAGVLFLVTVRLVDVGHVRMILRANRGDAAVLVATFVATLLLELDFAILLGVMVSVVAYLRGTSRPSVLVRVPDPRQPRRQFTTDPGLAECPQLRIVRIDGSLFFGAVSYVRERLRVIADNNPAQKHLLILARSVNFVDVAGAELLAQEARQRRAAGGALYLTHVKPAAEETLRNSGYLATIGQDNLFSSKTEAIGEIFERIDRSICTRCEKRIFKECATLPPPPTTGGGVTARAGSR